MSFHVGLGCRLADGLKRTAVAVDGNYTIYGTSTGLIEVYEGAGGPTSRAWGRRCFRRLPPGLTYETPAGASSLVVSPARVVTGRGAGRVYRLLQVIPLGERAVRPRVQQKASSSHLSEAVLRQADVAVSLRGVDGRGLGGAAAGYVGLVSVGWGVEGRRYVSFRMERPIVARAVCRATPAVSGPLGNDTAVEVEVAAEEVV